MSVDGTVLSGKPPGRYVVPFDAEELSLRVALRGDAGSLPRGWEVRWRVGPASGAASGGGGGAAAVASTGNEWILPADLLPGIGEEVSIVATLTWLRATDSGGDRAVDVQSVRVVLSRPRAPKLARTQCNPASHLTPAESTRCSPYPRP